MALSEPAIGPEEISDRLDRLREDINTTCSEIERQAKTTEKQGRAARSWDMLLRSTTAVLAVAAPALVTYSTRPEVDPIYQLFAIILTGIAGAATTLQAIFGLRQSYVRNATSALSMRHVVRDLRSESDAAFKQDNKLESIGMVRLMLDRARSKASELQLSEARARIEDYKSE